MTRNQSINNINNGDLSSMQSQSSFDSLDNNMALIAQKSTIDEDQVLKDLKQRLEIYLTQNQINAIERGGMVYPSANSGSQFSMANISTRSFRSTQLAGSLQFSRDKVLLRRQYDKLKDQHQQKLKILRTYQKEYLTLKQGKSEGESSHSPEKLQQQRNTLMMLLNSSTILTVNQTDSTLDYSNIDSVRSRIEIQQMKLQFVLDKLEDAIKEKRTLQDMLRKQKHSLDIDKKEKNKLSEQLAEIEKIVYSVENIRYLKSGRTLVVEGLNSNHKFFFEKEILKVQQNLQLQQERLEIEQAETQDYLKRYLEHLKKIKQHKYDLEILNKHKLQYEESQKQLLVMIRNKQLEYSVLKQLYAICYLKKALEQRNIIARETVSGLEFETQTHDLAIQFQEQMIEARILEHLSNFVNVRIGSSPNPENQVDQLMINGPMEQDIECYFRYLDIYDKVFTEMNEKEEKQFFGNVIKMFARIGIRFQFLQNRAQQLVAEKRKSIDQLSKLKLLTKKLQLDKEKLGEFQTSNRSVVNLSITNFEYKDEKFNLQVKIKDETLKLSRITIYLQTILIQIATTKLDPLFQYMRQLAPGLLAYDTLIQNIVKKYSTSIITSNQVLNIQELKYEIHSNNGDNCGIQDQIFQTFIEIKGDLKTTIEKLHDLIAYISKDNTVVDRELMKRKTSNYKNALKDFNQYFQKLSNDPKIQSLELFEIKKAVEDYLEMPGPEKIFLTADGEENNDNLTQIDEEQDEFQNQIRKPQALQSIIQSKYKRRITSLYKSGADDFKTKIIKQRNQLVSFEREELHFMQNLRQKIKKEFDIMKDKNFYDVNMYTINKKKQEKQQLDDTKSTDTWTEVKQRIKPEKSNQKKMSLNLSKIEEELNPLKLKKFVTRNEINREKFQKVNQSYQQQSNNQINKSIDVRKTIELPKLTERNSFKKAMDLYKVKGSSTSRVKTQRNATLTTETSIQQFNQTIDLKTDDSAVFITNIDTSITSSNNELNSSRFPDIKLK